LSFCALLDASGALGLPSGMDRRHFLLTLLAGVLAGPLAAEAQAGKVPRIGFLSAVPRSSPGIRAFEERLREIGYIAGRSITIEFRTDPGDYSLLHGFADELVRLNVDMLVAGGAEPTARAARQVAGTLPIVIVAIDYDPVALGYVASLARPGGNITGVVLQQVELTKKRMELLREAFPKLSRVAILWEVSAPDQFKAADAAARSLGLRVQSVELQSFSYDLTAAFAAAIGGRAGAVLVTTTPILFRNRTLVAQLAAKNRLPTMFALGEFVEAGGLLAYGASLTSMYADAATYVDKILKGAKPADLPVEQPTKFDLVINLKTAKALGLTIPPSLLARADQVLE
jgi:putative tryptophan/tyrosine transport system substrate-binding protein